MAPAEAGKAFARLRLDTTTPFKTSNLHIKKDSARDSDESDGADQLRQEETRASRHGAPRPLNGSGPGSASEVYIPEEAILDDSLHVSTETTPEKALELAFRRRKTSISFAENVTLDNGDDVPLEKPLPKPESQAQLSQRGRSILQEMYEQERKYSRAYSDSRMNEYDPDTGRRINRKQEQEQKQYKTGQPRWPMLSTTMDDLAHDDENHQFERMSSFTSSTSQSPTTREINTPLTELASITSSPMQKPTSPMGFPTGTPRSSRSVAQRSRSYREIGSLRRDGSRRTSRGSNSAKSPASHFLSMFNKDAVSRQPDPDDEGQEIGDHSGYIIGAQIGVGGFSVVKEVLSFEQGRKVRNAVKIVRKQVAGQEEEANEKLQTELEHEVSVWRYLKHTNILPLLSVYQTPFATFCITRLIQGGTLFDLIHSRRKAKEGGLPLNLAKRYVYQLASAIRYLHEDVRVVHRDIKLENVLIDTSAADAAEHGGNILLCDFGMADFINNEDRAEPESFENDEQHFGPGDFSTSVTGSLRYAAPEVFKTRHQLYSPAVDMWAFGAVVYAMLSAQLAFSDPFEPRVAMQIMRGEWDEKKLYDAAAVSGKDDEVIRMVRGCLTLNANQRWTISDVLDSPWLDGCAELYDQQDCFWAQT